MFNLNRMVATRRRLRRWQTEPSLLPTLAGLVVLLVAARGATSAGADEPRPVSTPLVSASGGQPFRDIRRDAVLVGVRVTVDNASPPWRLDSICSLQPIYRLQSGELARGPIYGVDRGLELVSEAEPGYAVGRLAVSRGTQINGLRCVFQRLRDGALDASDQYEGRWLGALSEKPPVEVSTEGKLSIGIAGRAENVLFAIGLLLAPNPR